MENKSNKLAVISLIINAVLVIAVIILFVKMPSGSGDEDVVVSNDSTVQLDVSKMHEKGQSAVIVYYNSDSLNTQSKFVMDLQNEIMTAQTDAEKQLQSEQSKMMSWEKKWKDKGMLTTTEQEQYMKEGTKMQEDMMVLQQTLEQQLYEVQNTLTLTGIQRITKYTQDLALANGYDFVLSYQLGGQVVFVNPKMDITAELIELMNADWDATFAEEGEEVAPAE